VREPDAAAVAAAAAAAAAAAPDTPWAASGGSGESAPGDTAGGGECNSDMCRGGRPVTPRSACGVDADTGEESDAAVSAPAVAWPTAPPPRPGARGHGHPADAPGPPPCARRAAVASVVGVVSSGENGRRPPSSGDVGDVALSRRRVTA